MNELYLRRRLRLHVQPGTACVTPQRMAGMMQELEALGFVLADDLVSRLSTWSPEDAARLLRDATREMRKLVGAHRQHVPLHAGFPAQVMALSDAQLYLNAVSHYVSLRRIPSEGDERPRC